MKIKNLTDEILYIEIGCVGSDFPFYTFELKPSGGKNSVFELDERVHLDFLNQLVIRKERLLKDENKS